MTNGDGVRLFLATVLGLIVGAVAGAVAAAVTGFALLALTLTLTRTTGDQATGASGLILLAIPFGVIIGAMVGVKQAIKYFAPPETK